LNLILGGVFRDQTFVQITANDGTEPLGDLEFTEMNGSYVPFADFSKTPSR